MATKPPTFRWLLPIFLGLLVLLASCGPGFSPMGGPGGNDSQLAGGGTGGTGDGGGSPDDGGDGTTTIEIDLVGRYAPGIQTLDVTVKSIALHMKSENSDSEGSSWRNLPVDPQTLDILQLTDGNKAVLVNAAVDPGTYDAVRVRFLDASLTVFDYTYSMRLTDDGQSVSTINPSRPLTALAGDDVYRVTLDFDPIRSVQSTRDSRFLLNPTLSVVDPDAQGSVTGRVLPLGIGAVVSAFDARTGKLVASALVGENGSYTLPRLRAMDNSGQAVRYDLEATAPLYETSAAYTGVAPDPGGDVSGYDFLLTPESADTSASGGAAWWQPGSGR